MGTSGRILVELPGAKDVERVKNLLQSTAQLEFWETYKNEQFFAFLNQANEVVKEIEASSAVAEEEKSEDSAIDDLLADVEAQDSITPSAANPILDLVRGYGYQGGPILAQFAKKDMDKVKGYLDLPEVRKLLPANLRYVNLCLGKPNPNADIVDLYVIKSNRDGVAPLSGGVIVDAVQTYSQIGQPAVSMQMDAKGARIWENMTGKPLKKEAISPSF